MFYDFKTSVSIKSTCDDRTKPKEGNRLLHRDDSDLNHIFRSFESQISARGPVLVNLIVSFKKVLLLLWEIYFYNFS